VSWDGKMGIKRKDWRDLHRLERELEELEPFLDESEYEELKGRIDESKRVFNRKTIRFLQYRLNEIHNRIRERKITSQKSKLESKRKNELYQKTMFIIKNYSPIFEAPSIFGEQNIENAVNVLFNTSSLKDVENFFYNLIKRITHVVKCYKEGKFNYIISFKDEYKHGSLFLEPIILNKYNDSLENTDIDRMIIGLESYIEKIGYI
jgi:hypothetical protein